MPQDQDREQDFKHASDINLRTILMAFHNYHEVHGAFPPQACLDSSGKPGLSWRVLLLPYLEQEELYGEFCLDEPWDNEHNRRLVDRMPEAYRLPGRDLGPRTNYLLLTGERTHYKDQAGPRLADIMQSGISDQILLVEVNVERAVPWTKPEDYIVDPNRPAADLGDIWTDGCWAGFASGEIHQLQKPVESDRRFWRIANPNLGQDVVDDMS